MVILVGYFVVSLLAAGAVYVLSNPYGHLTKTQQWWQTIAAFFLWPFGLAEIVGVIIWDWFRNNR